LQLLDLFDGKMTLSELEEMDLPSLTSLVEARIQLVNERAEAQAKALRESSKSKK
jgi:hypothetical protein